jgi:threonine/homoserine/homoserine lactone efflux protein
MSLSGFIGYSCALAIAAIIPGPQIFAIVAQALRRGYGRAAWMTLGMVLGDVLYLTAVLVGLAFVAETLSFVLIAIKWAGVVYLSWLAVEFWKSDTELGEMELEKGSSGKNAFISGMLVTLGNPKSVLFYISIMPTIVNLRSITQMDALILLAITGTILLAVQLPFAVAAARTRHFFRSPGRLRLVNRSAAVCMGGAAAAVALRK